MRQGTCWLVWKSGKMERTALSGARQQRWVLHRTHMETHTFEAQLWKIPALSEGVGLLDCYFYREVS